MVWVHQWPAGVRVFQWTGWFCGVSREYVIFCASVDLVVSDVSID